MKIKEALYRDSLISLANYNEEMKGSLYCPCCRIPITYVAKHLRRLQNIEIEVSPYFRVSKNPHLSSCKYLVKNRINEIYRNIKEQDEQYDFIEKQDDNQFRFQLRIITDENFPTKSKSPKNYGNKKSIDEFHKKQQKAFLKTVEDIISLRDSIEADEEKDLKGMFQLTYYNRNKKNYENISWNHFYFCDDAESYRSMYSYIENHSPSHPFCVAGQIKRIVQREKFKQIILKSHRKNDRDLISIIFSTKSDSVIEKLNEKQNIVVYAQGFKIYKNEKKTDNYKNFYCNIEAWINVPEQIVLIL